jgi:hypothetical protein
MSDYDSSSSDEFSDQFRPSNVLAELPRLVDSLGEWLDAVEQGLLPDSAEVKKAVKLARLVMTLWPDCPYVSSAVERHDTLLGVRQTLLAELSAQAEKVKEGAGGSVVSLFRARD